VAKGVAVISIGAHDFDPLNRPIRRHRVRCASVRCVGSCPSPRRPVDRERDPRALGVARLDPVAAALVLDSVMSAWADLDTSLIHNNTKSPNPPIAIRAQTYQYYQSVH